MRVRRAQDADAAGIRRVHIASVQHLSTADYPRAIIDAWSRPRPLEQFRAAISSNPFYVAEEDGEVVGFAELVVSRGEVRAVYVAPSYARRGVASQLLAVLEEEALAHGLGELRLESSLTAVPFYEACGFVVVQDGRFQLEGGVEMDSVLMRKVVGTTESMNRDVRSKD